MLLAARAQMAPSGTPAKTPTLPLWAAALPMPASRMDVQHQISGLPIYLKTLMKVLRTPPYLILRQS